MAKLGGEEKEAVIGAHWNEKLNNLLKEVTEERQNKNKNPKSGLKVSEPNGEKQNTKGRKNKPEQSETTKIRKPIVRFHWLIFFA